MNTLAEELNAVLDGSAAARLLSDMGRRMYFPKGIISQSAEADAKAKRFNATIGMAYSAGAPLILDAIRGAFSTLSPAEAVSYSSTGGLAELRKRWKAEMLRKNPSLAGKSYSLPVVVPGLTAAVSFIADLFVGPDDIVVMPDLYWPNYRLIIEDRKSAVGLTFPTFAPASNGRLGFNVAGLEAKLREAGSRRKKAVCLLNFPNNPTGYSPTLDEAAGIVAALTRVANEGTDILVVTDDAYFGLQYEENLLRESLFARAADAHPRIVCAKADGPTKEDYVWGFRVGFITFAGKDLTEARQNALIQKLLGVVRSAVSSSSTPAQHIFLKALDAPGNDAQKLRYHELLEERYRQAKAALASKPLPSCLRPLPFNSGYFMSFECVGISAEALRVKLLEERSIGTVSMQDRYLRVAFASVEAEHVGALYGEIIDVAAELGRAGG